MIHRRSFITGLISLVAAPAIVRAGSLMPVKAMVEPQRDLHLGIYPRFLTELGAYGVAAFKMTDAGLVHVPVERLWWR